MNIWFSVDNNKDILKLPYVFPDSEIGSQLNTQSFETASGKILTLIGKEGLRTLTIELIGAVGSVIVNMLCVIKSFSYSEKHNKDVSYTLEIEEYLEPEVIT